MSYVVMKRLDEQVSLVSDRIFGSRQQALKELSELLGTTVDESGAEFLILDVDAASPVLLLPVEPERAAEPETATFGDDTYPIGAFTPETPIRVDEEILEGEFDAQTAEPEPPEGGFVVAEPQVEVLVEEVFVEESLAEADAEAVAGAAPDLEEVEQTLDELLPAPEPAEAIEAEPSAETEEAEESAEAEPEAEPEAPAEAAEGHAEESEPQAVPEGEPQGDADEPEPEPEPVPDMPGYAAGESDLDTLTCEDCVYVTTCPNKEERTPSACGSFQWVSV